MARLDIPWQKTQEIAPKGVVTGEAAEATEAAAKSVAERPMWIFVTGDASDDTMRKLEDVVFKNEKVGIAAKLFRCVKMAEVDAAADRVVKSAGRGTPRMVFLRRDYTVHTVLDAGKMSASSILKAMKALSAQTYENNFDTLLKEYAGLLNELDRLDSVRKKLETDKARLEGDKNPAKLKKYERDLKEFEDQSNAWNASEQKLLAFRAKGEKSPEA